MVKNIFAFGFLFFASLHGEHVHLHNSHRPHHKVVAPWHA